MIASWFQTTSIRIGISFPQTGNLEMAPLGCPVSSNYNGHNFGYPIFRHTHDRCLVKSCWIMNHIESLLFQWWSHVKSPFRLVKSLCVQRKTPMFQVSEAQARPHIRETHQEPPDSWRNQHSLSRPNIWLFPTLLLQRVWGASWGGSVWDLITTFSYSDGHLLTDINGNNKNSPWAMGSGEIMIPNQIIGDDSQSIHIINICINYHLHPFTSWRRAEVVTTHRILDQPSIGSRKTLSTVDFGWSECFNKTMITSNPIQICRNPAECVAGNPKKWAPLLQRRASEVSLPIRNGDLIIFGYGIFMGYSLEMPQSWGKDKFAACRSNWWRKDLRNNRNTDDTGFAVRRDRFIWNMIV